MPLFRKCDLQAQFTTNYKLPLTSYNELEQLRTIYTNVEQVRLNQNNNNNNNNNYDDNKNNSNENKNNNYYVCYPFPWKESMSDPWCGHRLRSAVRCGRRHRTPSKG